uniref:Uncharacterized protein n=1 Tax=Ciona intestinalis TaxID=7719 RepID=H2XR74_CIOIN
MLLVQYNSFGLGGRMVYKNNGSQLTAYNPLISVFRLNKFTKKGK